MITAVTPRFNGVSFVCPKCGWKVTMTSTYNWEMLQIDKIMQRHIRRCKGVLK